MDTGNPEDEKTLIGVHIRVPPVLWQTVRLLAFHEGTSAQALTVEALKQLLGRRDKASKRKARGGDGA